MPRADRVHRVAGQTPEEDLQSVSGLSETDDYILLILTWYLVAEASDIVTLLGNGKSVAISDLHVTISDYHGTRTGRHSTSIPIFC